MPTEAELKLRNQAGDLVDWVINDDGSLPVKDVGTGDPVRVGPVLLTTTVTTVYTVPAGKTAIMKMITFANSSVNSVTVLLSIGADSIGTRLVPDVRIPGQTQLDEPTWHVLAAGETLRASSGIASSVALTISLIEVT